MPIAIESSKVLVTGATGGIGHAIARDLHRRGALLTLSGRRVEVLDQLQAELGDRVEVIAADLADPDDVRRLAEEDFDVLVSNAALPASGHFEGFSADEIDRALNINLRAPLQLARALAPAMIENGRGHVVLVSSLAGKVASPGSSIYCATKFGLRGFGFALNEDLHGTGVGATTVFPGFISDAGMFHDSGTRLPKGVAMRSPEQVAEAVARGIENGHAEIDVAPLVLRLAAWLFGVAPSLIATVQRKLGGEAISRRIADAQRSKR